jgi:superfamily II DNA or RNA helicase/SAM-dependent methyltransferase
METTTSNSYGNLYAHQKECVNKIEDHFQSGHTKGLIKMFCGTGKSLIQHHLFCQNQKTLLIVPSIALTTQFVEHYIIKRGFPHPFITICSKNEISEEVIQKINISVTTTEEDIKRFFKKNKSVFFVCCTYQSLHKLLSCVNFKFDLCILDEAHRSLGETTQKLIFDKKQNEDEEDVEEGEDSDEDLYEQEDEICKEIDSQNDIKSKSPNTKISELCNKILFFTATPKNANRIRMTGPKSDCGELIFDYPLRQAVEDNVLMDFEICINISKQAQNVDKKVSVFEAISRNALSTGNYKVMIFHALANESDKKKGLTSVKDYVSDKNKKLFKDIFYRIHQTKFPEKVVSGFKYEGIVSETEAEKRKKIIESEFGKDKNEFYAISSCRTLGEGIDTKCCNHVCWVDPKQSFVEIIQNIGRCSRKKENWGVPSNKKSTITIPITIDAGFYESCDTPESRDKVIREEMQNSENWNPLFNVLSALKQNDPEYYDLCLIYPKKFCQRDYERHNKLTKRAQVEVDKEDQSENSNAVLDVEENLDENKNNKTKKVIEDKVESTSKKIEDYANDLVTPVELYTNSMEEPVKVIGENKEGEVQRIYGNDETGEIFNMEEKEKGKGIQVPKRKKTNIRTHVDHEIQVLWKIRDGYDFTKDVTCAFLDCQVVDNDDKWMENYEKLKVNQKLSHWRTKQGAWENTQRLKFNSGTLKQNRIELLNQISFWKWILNNDDEVFEEKRSQYENFYINHQEIPSQSSTNDEEKMLAQWRADQIKMHNNKSKVKRNEERIKKLNNTKGWYWDIWYYNFDKYCEFINLNKKRPPRKHQLGAWENTQRLAYHVTIESDLDDKKISKLESIPGWKWKMDTKENKWMIQYSRSKSFTIENLRLAQGIKSPKNQTQKLENKIADWNNAQRRKKRNSNIDKNKLTKNQMHRGTLTDEQIKLLEEIPGWYWNKSPVSSTRGSSPNKPPSPPKPRSYLRPIPNLKEEKSSSLSIPPSELSTFHKNFKTMNSSKYFNHIQSNPDLFKEYHRLAKQAEENDNPEDKPLHILANQINKLPPNQRIADLGCGDAVLSTLCPKHKFTNIDAYALNDKVQVHNIAKLPNKFHHQFDVVVLSRVLWATNKEQVIQEAIKLMKPNGYMYICEPFRRWNRDFKTNKLEILLQRLDLQILWKLNTKVENKQYHKFMYYALTPSTYDQIMFGILSRLKWISQNGSDKQLIQSQKQIKSFRNIQQLFLIHKVIMIQRYVRKNILSQK